MPQKYSTADNMVYASNPFDWSRGGRSKVGATLDPFNLTGWGEKSFNIYYSVPDVTRPNYSPTFDPMNMQLAGEIEGRLGKLQLDKRGLDRFREEALRRGPSSWSKLSTQKQFAEELAGRERAKQEARASQAQAEADLAMRGGLSSGARERLTSGGARNLLAMSQDVSRQGNINRMGIGIQDESNRLSSLQALPGMEIAALQPELQKEQMWEQTRQADIQRIMAENERRNQWNMQLYQEQMKDRAAAQQANATMNSGKK